MLWAVHPLQTESVTYVVQRAESMMGLFYLLTLYCFLRGAESDRAIVWYAGSLLACLLGMATKEVMVTAPLIMLLYDRTFLAGSFRDALRQRYGLYLALAFTWGVVASLSCSTGFRGGTAGFTVKEFTWWSYLLTQAEVIAHYLRLAFWPSGLCLDYGWPAAHNVGNVLFPVMLVMGLLGLTAWAMVKRPAWGFLGAWFFLILAPTSSILPIRDAAVEHRMYLPLAAVISGAVAGGWLVARRFEHRGIVSRAALRIGGTCLVISATVALAVVTFRRNMDYQSVLAIWEDTVGKAPSNGQAHNNLGIVLAGLGRGDEAIAHYQEFLKIKPDDASLHNSLGLLLAQRGEIAAGIAHIREALQVAPDRPEGLRNLAWILATCPDIRFRQGAEAVRLAQRACELTHHENPDFLRTLADAYMEN